jgi:predicted amidohydrolase
MSSAAQPLVVGMAQMLVRAGAPADNLARAAQRIGQAAHAGCDVVVLPECLDIGWGDGRARDLAQPIPGAHAQVLADAARAHRVVVVAGLVERAGGVLHNAAVLIDEQGQLRHVHRKLHELSEVTGGLYVAGSSLGVVHTRHGTIGIPICADNAPESLEIGYELALMGAQVLLSPCAWAVPPGHDNVREPYGALWRGAYGDLARVHGLPVVGVSSVGRLEDGAWNGWPVIGASLAMGLDGQVVGQGRYGEAADELIVVEVELRAATAKAITTRTKPHR